MHTLLHSTVVKLGLLYALECISVLSKLPRCYAVAAANLGLIPCIEDVK